MSTDLMSQPWVARAGWTLVHFLWQGTVLALFYAAIRWLTTQRLSAQVRYLLGCATLLLMTVSPFLTFVLLGTSATGPANATLWRITPASLWQQALPWLVVAWIAGVGVSSARLLAGFRATVRLRTNNVVAAPAEWRLALSEIATRVRVAKPVRLLVSSLVAVPTVVGWLRPVILLPATALTGLEPQQLEALLAHELGHIRRHDYLINILQNVAEAILFYHPAVWWVSEQIRSDREMCCDDIAVEASGDALLYASALADLESRRFAPAGLSMAANGGSLLNRIRRLAGKPERAADNLPGSGAAWAVGVLWLVGVGAMTLHGAPAKPPVVYRQIANTPQPIAAPAPPSRQAPVLFAQKVTKTLLFDPFFDQPQNQQAKPASSDATTPVSSEQDQIHVSGTVVGGAHEPLKKATVRLEVIVSSGQAAAYSETTDETGKFVIDNIAPGNYRMSAAKTGFVTAQYGARTIAAPGATVALKAGANLKDLEIALSPQGTIAGRITDQDGDPVVRAPITILRSGYEHGRKQLVSSNLRAQTDDTGRFRIGNVPPGRYFLKAEQQNQPPDLEPGTADLPTFYPAARDAASAAPIVVAAGSRIEAINVKLRRSRAYSVKGTVLLDGAPVNSILDKRLASETSQQAGSIVSVQNGALALSNMEPGTYSLSVVPSGTVAPGLPFSLGLTGQVEFTVRDSNIEGLVLNLEHGVELSGAFQVEGADWQTLVAPASPGAQPRLPFINLVADPALRFTPINRVNPDGTFQLKPMAVGRYLVDITSLPTGTYVKSVRYGTLDVSNSPINVVNGGGELQILLSTKAASITGALKSVTGDPLYGMQITAWPQNPNPGTVTRGIVSVYTDQNGAFTIRGLAPGTYHVAAWEEIDSGLAQDAAFLQHFEGQAATVTLEESGQKTADLKPISADAVAKEAAQLPQ